MKGNNVLILLMFFFIWSCASINYKEMAVEDPTKLIAIRDSLDNNLSPSIVEALVIAYNNIGISALKLNNYEASINSFSKSQELLNTDKVSNYYLLMVRAHQKYNTGKKEYLWEAIQNYYKASEIYPLKGEPFYYIGKSYLKIGDKDFDLILESYDKALSLEVESDVKNLIREDRIEVLRRKELLKNFWK